MAKFLIEHGIDLTIRDYRWNGTAEGWAYNAAQDEDVTMSERDLPQLAGCTAIGVFAMPAAGQQ